MGRLYSKICRADFPFKKRLHLARKRTARMASGHRMATDLHGSAPAAGGCLHVLYLTRTASNAATERTRTMPPRFYLRGNHRARLPWQRDGSRRQQQKCSHRDKNSDRMSDARRRRMGGTACVMSDARRRRMGGTACVLRFEDLWRWRWVGLHVFVCVYLDFMSNYYRLTFTASR